MNNSNQAGESPIKRYSPVKAIRAKCEWCCSGQLKEIRLCPCKDCPCYPFRMGTNPYRKRRSSNRDFHDEEPLTIQLSPEE